MQSLEVSDMLHHTINYTTMSGEYIQAETINAYWKELQTIYKDRSTEWKDITKEEYESLERSEREDSDNHLNEDRLNDDNDTNVVDYCFYKYLPNREAAYKITVQHKKGDKKEYYFQITLKEESE